MEKTNLNFRHGPRKFLTLPLLFMLVGLGISPQKAWADYTFASGKVIYVDMTGFTKSNFQCYIFDNAGTKYTAEKVGEDGSFTFTGYNNGQFNNCNAPVMIKLTFTEAVNYSSGKSHV